MKIAVMTYSFARLLASDELDTAMIVRGLRELGVSAVEISDNYLDGEDLPRIQAALTEAGVEVACYDVYCDFITPDRAIRRTQVAKVQTGLERAARLGANQVMIVPGWITDDTSPAVARERIIEGLKECMPFARRLGVRPAIENLGFQWTVYGRSDHLNAICEAVGPPLSVTYDVGNFVFAGEDSMQALDRVAARISHVHFKDWQVIPAPAERVEGELNGADGRRYLGAALGEGVVNLKGATAKLRQLGYQGYVSVEYEGLENPWEAMRRGVMYCRSLL